MKINYNSPNFNHNPAEILESIEKETLEYGGCCCLLLTLEKEKNILNSAQIGDSRYILLRKKDILFESQSQEKSFNLAETIGTPYRGLIRKEIHEILENDIIIAGSDGFFDNVWNDDIIKFMKDFYNLNGEIDVELLAELLGKYAFDKSRNSSYNSPFSERAKTNYIDFYGGIIDDITVIISQIKLKEEKK